MEFVETPTFTRRLNLLLPDASYRELQKEMDANPEIGDLIRGTGGARKVRWNLPGTGKRGGVRVIYYHNKRESRCYMLLTYGKNEQDDLTETQKNMLKNLIREHLS